MLRNPIRTKFKSQHTFFTTKGIKGTQKIKRIVSVKIKKDYFFTPQQHQLSKRLFSRRVKDKGGKLNIRFFPHLSLTKKPLQVRMGKGKGKHHRWVAPLKRGAVILEISGRYIKTRIKNIYSHLKYKLPVESKLIIPKSSRRFLKEKLKLMIK